MRNENQRYMKNISVLVVDDEELIRSLLYEAITRHFRGGCSLAKDATEALQTMEKKKIDVVITDIMMPGTDGVELIEIIKQKYDSDIIAMTGYPEKASYEGIIQRGASDFLLKPIKISELLLRLERVLTFRSLLQQRNKAIKGYRASLDNMRMAMEEVVQLLALTVETRDPYTAGHQRRVSALASAIAEGMSLPQEKIDVIRMAGIIHDLGKISVPSEILSKPTKLTAIEFGLIKIHPKVGHDLLKTIKFPWPIADFVLQHHEKLDGSGYPLGLKNEEILLESKILVVADVVEAMASHRPYRPALGVDKALSEIFQHKDQFYDPEVVDVCVTLFEKHHYKIID